MMNQAPHNRQASGKGVKSSLWRNIVRHPALLAMGCVVALTISGCQLFRDESSSVRRVKAELLLSAETLPKQTTVKSFDVQGQRLVLLLRNGASSPILPPSAINRKSGPGKSIDNDESEEADDTHTDNPGHANKESGDSEEDGQEATPHSYLMFAKNGESVASAPLPMSTEPGLLIQALNNNCFLISGDGTKGTIYDGEGKILKTITLGESINVMQAVPSDKDATDYICLGYEDTGVFSPDSLSKSGLAIVDSTGRVCFKLSSLSNSPEFKKVVDLLGINIVNPHDIWYVAGTTDEGRGWAVSEIKLGNPPSIDANYKIELANFLPSALAVNEEALLIFGYKASLLDIAAQEGRIYRIDRKTKEQLKIVVQDDKGNTLNVTQAFGRGSKLYALANNSVYCIDLNNIVRW